MGAKTTIKTTTPSSTHISAAQALGRNPTMLHALAAEQINTTIILLKQIVADTTLGNPSDPNIATLQTVITNLS